MSVFDETNLGFFTLGHKGATNFYVESLKTYEYEATPAHVFNSTFCPDQQTASELFGMDTIVTDFNHTSISCAPAPDIFINATEAPTLMNKFFIEPNSGITF